MKFDPRLFYDVAEKLLANCSTESEYRSVINRAYYAAFGFGRIVVNVETTGSSIHQDTSNKLMGFKYERSKKAGKMLQTLFNMRKKADYKYSEKVMKWECETSVKDAKEIIDHLIACQKYWIEKNE